ncbi:MAG TPA: helix-turn-helix domain-containing protein [Thermoanaerobaculia bacterium]|nr:helix-turn-helix domain-containing protein [Thermoanaerobaculia bacterium]
MSPRTYRMQRRADSAIETRRRIVEATHQLHIDKGVGATTFRDIAARADVGLGTVYHHFPTYDDVIAACGAYTFDLVQPPAPEVFASLTDPGDRIRMLVGELFAFHRRTPWMGRIRGERSQFAALERSLAQEEEHRRELVAAALRPLRPSKRTLALVVAVLDFAVYQSLIAAGLSHAAAVDETTQLIEHRLLDARSKR